MDEAKKRSEEHDIEAVNFFPFQGSDVVEQRR